MRFEKKLQAPVWVCLPLCRALLCAEVHALNLFNAAW